jgi:hypothetical protein
MSELKDEHYLRAVTELGDTRKIVADSDIYSESGIKLVAAGVQITSELYDRLVKHKLLPSFEKALSAENTLDSKILMEDVRFLLQANAKLERMFGIVDKSTLERQILSIQLPSSLAFKLTVAREKYPDIYRHGLLLMLIRADCTGIESAGTARFWWLPSLPPRRLIQTGKMCHGASSK